MATVHFIFIYLFYFFNGTLGNYHWIVTENGRIEAKGLDSPYPLLRSYDLMALLEQEQRVAAVAQMNELLIRKKNLIDQHWDNVGEESEFEANLYSMNEDCRHAGKPLAQFTITPTFLDIRQWERPLTKPDIVDRDPPDCSKYHKLDFSLFAYPHLPTLRDRRNITTVFRRDSNFNQKDADDMLIDITSMLNKNKSDWTAYNLGVSYWLTYGNISHALECARLAIYFAPSEHRYVPLVNLGALLHAYNALDEAAIILHAAVDIDRSQPRSYVALGDIYTLLGDWDRAIGFYKNAIALKPADVLEIAKQHSAIKCHKLLVNGLTGIESALQNLVRELQDYSDLQKDWIINLQTIGIERACGQAETPSPVDLLSVWKAVEKQSLRLTQKLADATPTRKPGAWRSIPSLDMSQEHGFPEKLPKKKSQKKKAKNAGGEVVDEIFSYVPHEKVAAFTKFMDELGEATPKLKQKELNERVAEKLMRIHNGFEGEQPKSSRYWTLLEKCRKAIHVDDLVEECGHAIFPMYMNAVGKRKMENRVSDEEEDDMVDESTIENYVDERRIFTADRSWRADEL